MKDMIPAMMKALLLGSMTLSLQAAASSAPKVVKMPIGQKANSHILRKRDPFAVSLQNFIPYGEYFVTASIGTPAQDVELVLDTGSSDIWMFSPAACNDVGCQGGSFNARSSSTLSPVDGGTGAFQIQYQTRNSEVTGDYIADVLSIGGVSVTDQTMAVATRVQKVYTGIIGIGLGTNEAAVSQGLGQYPTLVDNLVTQGKIASRSYCLYLDDLAQSRGSIIFGGYDYDRFKGDLTILPIQVDDQTGMRTSFTVSWTSIGVNMRGNDFALDTPGFVYPAVLDSGTTLTYMPTVLYEPLAEYFNTTTSRNFPGVVFVDCNVGKTHPGQLIFGLGGDDGVEIAVEFDELAVPVFDTRDGQQIRVKGQPQCQFGLSDAGEGYSILFGQTFLRSAYVLYDLENLRLGVAQTVFDVTTSNIMEYNGNSTTGRIETDTAGPTVGYTAAPGAASGGLSAVPGGFGTDYFGLSSATGGYFGFSSATGAFGAGETGFASAVPTSYSLTNLAYPSDAVPTAFPTVISPATTGRVGFAGNGNSGSSGSSSGSSSNSGSSSGSGSGSSENDQNRADSISPVFATAGALMLALFTTMLML